MKSLLMTLMLALCLFNQAIAQTAPKNAPKESLKEQAQGNALDPLCQEGGDFSGLLASKASEACHKKTGFLTVAAGICSCNTSLSGLFCKSGKYDGVDAYYARYKCLQDGESNFDYGGGDCKCLKPDCSYEVKDMTQVDEQDYSCAVPREGKKGFDKQVQVMQEEVCKEFDKQLKHKDVVDHMAACSGGAKFKSDESVELSYSVGEGEHAITCKTTIDTRNADLKIDNLGKSFPNNISSFDPEAYSDCKGGKAKILDKDVIAYKAGNDTIKCDELDTIKAADELVRKAYSEKIDQVIATVLAEAEKSGKNPQEVVDEFMDSLNIKLDIASYASLLNTTTKFSNPELAHERSDRTFEYLQKVIGRGLQEKFAAKNITIDISNLDQFITRGESSVNQFGTLGPMVYTENEQSFRKVFAEAQSEGRFAECSSTATNFEQYREEIFKCSLESYIVNDCPKLAPSFQKDTFKECQDRQTFVIDLKDKKNQKVALPKVGRLVKDADGKPSHFIRDDWFDSYYNNPANPIGAMKVAFLKKSHKAPEFDKYKHFSIGTDVSYAFKDKKTVQDTAKKKTTVIDCPFQFKDGERAKKMVDFKKGYKAHINYNVDYKNVDKLTESQGYRFVKKPAGLFRRMFDKDCVESRKKVKKHYKLNLGKDWRKGFKANKQNYKNLGPNKYSRNAGYERAQASEQKVLEYKDDFNQFEHKFKPVEHQSEVKSEVKTKEVQFAAVYYKGYPEITVKINGKDRGRQTINSKAKLDKDGKILSGYTKFKFISKLNKGDVMEVCYYHDDYKSETEDRRLFYKQITADGQSYEAEILEGLIFNENTAERKEENQKNKKHKACRLFVF